MSIRFCRQLITCVACTTTISCVGLAQNAVTPERISISVHDSGAGSHMPATSPAVGSQFVLGAADIIHVNVWKNTELSQTVTVDPNGFVSLPLLGDVQVAGMTANELGQALTVKLNSFLVNPIVTVSVVDIRSRQVYVLGQVNKPGGYPLIAPIKVLQIIAQAGGLSNYANRKSIVILRPSQNGTARLIFNYNTVVRGDGKQNIDLQPGDTVIVP